ncbi:MAG TPA: hypothetical protein VFW46_15360 [Stellaceae bacterium]|nr:hypothetical protein [Stellaceae bacterium]
MPISEDFGAPGGAGSIELGNAGLDLDHRDGREKQIFGMVLELLPDIGRHRRFARRMRSKRMYQAASHS